MSRRKRRSLKCQPGTLLDGVPGGEMGILQWTALPASKRQALTDGDNGLRCCCPARQRNRLGGCKPALTWADADHSALKPICITCMKPLVSGTHRRRDQTHAIALSKMRLDHIDLADLEAAGMFIERSTRFDPGEIDRAMEQFQLERVGGLPDGFRSPSHRRRCDPATNRHARLAMAAWC